MVKNISDDRLYNLHADFCKIMANPKRLKIIEILDDGEMCVEEIARQTGMSMSNVSQHLSIFRQKGIVETRREGLSIYYKITSLKIQKACGLMREAMFELIQNNSNIVKDMREE